MSKGGPFKDEWSILPDVALLIWQRFGRPVADLFANKENAQCLLWYSLREGKSPPSWEWMP